MSEVRIKRAGVKNFPLRVLPRRLHAGDGTTALALP